MKKLIGYLRLMRLANIVTAISDILAGVAIGGSLVAIAFGASAGPHVPLGELIFRESSLDSLRPLFLLVLSTIGLYGGGVVLNDVFDARLDQVERPERPIPSGLISKSSAAAFGMLLLLAGIVAAGLSNEETFFSSSCILAVIIAASAVSYDKWLKHNRFLGPLAMGFCRGCNLLLGMSLFSYSLGIFWYVAIAPVIYIAAITMISRGEVHGGKKTTLYAAAAFYGLVILSILALSYINDSLGSSVPFLLLFCFMIFRPLAQAIKRPEGPLIGKAVKGGVIALIVMNAAWAAAFNDLIFAVVIVLLLPLSLLLARMFAVT